jgi:hypothetical protein
MVAFFDPASMCNMQPGILLAPLPSPRQLWEASSSLAWTMESEKHAGAQAAFGLTSTGDLVQFDGPYTYANNLLDILGSIKSPGTYTVANWSEWCADMDGLGTLVMLAASMVA